VVTLAKSFTTKFSPDITSLVSRSLLLLKRERTFHGSLNVTTCKSKSETSLRVANKVERHFGEALCLEISDNGTSAETRVLNHVHDLSVLLRGVRYILREVSQSSQVNEYILIALTFLFASANLKRASVVSILMTLDLASLSRQNSWSLTTRVA